MFFLSCRTTRTIKEETIYIPEIEWPQFPLLGDYEKTKDGRVIVDENYFVNLLIFRTSYYDVISEYNDKKKLLLEENNNE